MSVGFVSVDFFIDFYFLRLFGLQRLVRNRPAMNLTDGLVGLVFRCQTQRLNTYCVPTFRIRGMCQSVRHLCLEGAGTDFRTKFRLFGFSLPVKCEFPTLAEVSAQNLVTWLRA